MTRILVVGGVAGGATAAARIRRLCEACEIVVFDRGPHVSFANCGLPYFVGNVIPEEAQLLVASAELFRERFRIDVRTEHEVLAIDRSAKTIQVLDLRSGAVSLERYDALLLSPGAAPIRPPLPGIDHAGIFSLRTIPDSRRIRAWIRDHGVKKAVVVGAGFIGIEMAENLVHRGLDVTFVEASRQVMPPLDPEMAAFMAERLRDRGLNLLLGDAVAGFEWRDGKLLVATQSGAKIPADIVILAIGVRPETTLARAAGLALGERGGIVVDGTMRTNDPSIWAVGDAVETRDAVTGLNISVPLAGPANRQGRVAADAILGRKASYRGIQGTAVLGAFDMTVAMTGASEKTLRRNGTAFQSIYLHPGHHAGYYPGAKPIHLKLLFAPGNGRILGAQAVGEEGVEKRIDVIAAMIQLHGSVFDLEEAELSYAPQFGAAKDPVNVAGMIAANHLRGDLPLGRWDELDQALRSNAVVLDVRDESEYADGHIPGAINIPLTALRDRLDEIPSDREIWTYCGVGQRSYYAARLLMQNGRRIRNLSGGYAIYLRIKETLSQG